MSKVIARHTVCLSSIFFSVMVSADGLSSGIGQTIPPCTQSAIDAAAIRATGLVDASKGEAVHFYSFGPQNLSADELNDGANKAYWVGFESNFASHGIINLRVLMYCQQGGFNNVLKIDQK